MAAPFDLSQARDADALQRALDGTLAPADTPAHVASLVRTARQAASLPLPGPDAAFVASLATRLRTEAATPPSPQDARALPNNVIAIRRTWPKAVAGTAAGLVAASAAVGIGTQHVLPNNPLYGVRGAVDGLEVALAGSAAGRGRTHLDQARDHVDDTVTLADASPQDPNAIVVSLSDAAAALTSGQNVLFDDFAATRNTDDLGAIRDITTWARPRLATVEPKLPPQARATFHALTAVVDAGEARLNAALAACGHDCAAIPSIPGISASSGAVPSGTTSPSPTSPSTMLSSPTTSSTVSSTSAVASAAPSAPGSPPPVDASPGTAPGSVLPGPSVPGAVTPGTWTPGPVAPSTPPVVDPTRPDTPGTPSGTTGATTSPNGPAGGTTSTQGPTPPTPTPAPTTPPPTQDPTTRPPRPVHPCPPGHVWNGHDCHVRVRVVPTRSPSQTDAPSPATSPVVPPPVVRPTSIVTPSPSTSPDQTPPPVVLPTTSPQPLPTTQLTPTADPTAVPTTQTPTSIPTATVTITATPVPTASTSPTHCPPGRWWNGECHWPHDRWTVPVVAPTAAVVGTAETTPAAPFALPPAWLMTRAVLDLP